MNKNIILTLFFSLILILSISTVQASEIESDLDNTSILLENETSISNLNNTEMTCETPTSYGQYNVTLKDSDSGNTLANKSINVIINNNQYNATTDDNGVASINLMLKPGKYNVFTYFLGNDLFKPSNSTDTLKILPTIKASDISKYYKGTQKYSAQFFNNQGNALSNTLVNVNINGILYSKKTNKEGIVSFAVDLKPGTYKIIAENPVTGYSLTTTFKILSTITSSNIKQVEGENKKFNIKFFKSNGKALAKKYIKYKFKGKVYKVKTNSKGIVSISLKKLKKGTYKIISYNSDGLSKSSTVKIYKKKASTKISAQSYTYYLNETKKLKITFSTELNDKSCSGKVIKIKINGKTYSKKTDSKGVAYLTLPSMKKGLYKVEYTYGGNNFFKASKSTKYVTLIDTAKTAVKIKGTNSFGYGADTMLKVAYSAGGVPLIKKSVKITVEGKTYTRTTDNNGVASVIPIDLEIGNYTINYSTNNESKVNGTTGSLDINVFKRSPSKVTWKSGSSFKDNLQTFKIFVSDKKNNHVSGGIVELDIDGETYTGKVTSKGYATIKTSVAIGKYKVSVRFTGNNNYLSSSTSKNINVKLSKFGKGLNEKNAVGSSKYLKSSSHCQVGNSKIKKLVKSLTKGLTNDIDKAKAIFNYVRDTLDYDYYYNTHHGAIKTLNYKSGNCVDHSHLLVAMFRTAGFNARYVHGVCHFIKSGHTTGHVWTQVKIGKTWVCADPISYSNSLGKINNWNTKSYSIYSKYASLPF